MTVIAAYASTEDTPASEKDISYTLLEDAIRHVPPHDQLIITGGLNAVCGRDRSGFEQVVGPFGSGTTNDNSARLLTLCAATGISIVGSWFQPPDIRRLTWISNDGSQRMKSTIC